MHVQFAPPSEALLGTRPRPWLIGVIHLPALPGAPQATLPVDAIVERTVEDAQNLQQAGFTAVMVENYHDTPFRLDSVDPETVASMAVVAREVRRNVNVPVGVNVLRNDALAGLGVAVASGASFLRVNVLAGAAATDQGLVAGRADELARRRQALGASLLVLADVDVKHATSLDSRPLTARAADLVERAGAHAVLVTGEATGRPCDLAVLAAVRDAVAPAPVLAASGTTAQSLAEVLARCDGVIVGTALKDPATDRISVARASSYLTSSAP